MEPVSQEIGAGAEASSEVESDTPRAGGRPASDELRASLVAVRAARDAAQSRMRSDTQRVRLVSLMFLAAFVAGALAVAGHIRGRHRGAGKSPGAVMTAPPGFAMGSSGSGAGSSASANPASASAPAAGVDAPDAIAASGVVAAASAADFSAVLATCNSAYEDHVWPIATDACAHAADLHPRDAALTMKVAQAFHARGRYGDAGTWARRALALDGVDPEALVILAHAERRAGHPAAAKSAYRRYLVLAPRGWHAAEARAAVRVSERPRVRGGLESAATGRATPPPFASSVESNADQR
jgi:hypothetical protein